MSLLPRPPRLLRCAAALTLIVLVQACGGAAYNPTVFPFELDSERLGQSQIKTVVIPHVNLGAPSRNYLAKEAERIDGYVGSYLKENGYKVLPQRVFKQHWNTAVRAFGDPVDPTTGRVNMKTFSQIMQSVRDQLRKGKRVDAFVFTDLVELKIAFGGGLQHTARWDGVSRKPSMQGAGSGVSSDFDWNMQAAAASIQITIFDMELQRIFVSRGGMDVTDAIDARSSSGRYVRRRNMLESKDHVMEGIHIALHPFIDYEDWPGNP